MGVALTDDVKPINNRLVTLSMQWNVQTKHTLE